MSEIVFATGLITLSVSFWLLRKAGLTVIFVQIWWFFWLFLSTFSLTGLFSPSKDAIWLYILMLTSVTGGILIHNLAFRYFDKSGFVSFQESTEELDRSREKALEKIIVYFLFPIVLFFFFKAIYLMSTSVAPVDYRADVFGLRTGKSVLFESPKVGILYSIFVSPLLLASLFIGAGVYLTKGRLKIFAMACLLIGLDAFMMLGRFGFHYIIMLSFFLILGGAAIDWKKGLSVFSWRVLSIGISVILVILLIGYLRENRLGLAFDRFLKLFLLDYHTMSFSIFDKELHDPSSILHHWTYGRSSLAGLEKVFIYFGRFIGIPADPQADVIGAYLHEYKTVGMGANGRFISYNAFGSVMFGLYRDGGPIAISIFSILYGFVSAMASRSLEKQSLFGSSILASLFFIGIYGLFQPVLSGPILLAVVVILILFKRNFSSPKKEI